jgi:hypothetical protein
MTEHEVDVQPATVEWGEPSARRSAWWDRILGREAADPGLRRPAAPGSIGRLGAGLATAGFVFLLAAEVLPWMRLGSGDRAAQLRDQLGTDQLMLGQLGTWEVLSYHFGWILLLSVVCLAQVVSASNRRAVGAVGIGIAGGTVTVLSGLARSIGDGAGVLGSGTSNVDIQFNYGEGMYSAFAAVLLFVLAIVFAGRGTLRRRPEAGSDPDELDEIVDEEPAGPVDLTVTPLAPSETYGGRISGSDRWGDG